MERKELIDSIYRGLDAQTIETLYRIYNIINPKDTEDILNYLLDGRIENTDIANNIITCLEKNCELKMMSDFIRTDRLRINDVVNGHDLIQLCMNPQSGILFCEDTIKRFSREKDSGGVKVGEYEYLLRMFLNNVDIKDHRGDIVSDGATLELKCGSARISGSKTNSPAKIRERLNELLGTNYNVNEFNNGSIRQTPIFFESISHIGSDVLAEVLVESYLASYESIPLIYKEKLRTRTTSPSSSRRLSLSTMRRQSPLPPKASIISPSTVNSSSLPRNTQFPPANTSSTSKSGTKLHRQHYSLTATSSILIPVG